MVELKDHQQQEMEGKLQFHSRLMLMERMFASLKVLNFKVRVWGTNHTGLFLKMMGTQTLRIENPAHNF